MNICIFFKLNYVASLLPITLSTSKSCLGPTLINSQVFKNVSYIE